MKQPLLDFQPSLIRKHKSVGMFTNSLHPGTVVVHRLLFVCWEGSVHCVSPSASHTSHRFSSTAKCPWQAPLSQRQGTSCFHWVSVEYFQVNSVPAFTTLREKKHTYIYQPTPNSKHNRPPPLLPHLLVKKAMTGKAGSWESVKTFWRNRFGLQLCCR